MEGDTFIQSYPWLQWNLFYRISPGTCYTNIIDGLKDKVICAYCDGWAVLKDRKMHYLKNVNSLKKIILPPMTLKDTTCILTCSPSDSSCRVLFMAKNTILYCRPGKKTYMAHKLEEGMRIHEAMVARLEGKVYYITEGSLSSLAVVDCLGSTLQVTKVECLPLRTYTELCVSTIYLVESGGELLLVCKTHSSLSSRGEEASELYSFFVFQFNFLNKMWMEVDNIGRSTMFLRKDQSQSHGISFCATDPRIKQKSIYFLQPDNEYLHVYDLKDHSFSLLFNGLKMAISHNQEESSEDMGYEEQNMKFLPQLPSVISKLVLARTFTLDPGALGVIRSTCKDWGSIVRAPHLRLT